MKPIDALKPSVLAVLMLVSSCAYAQSMYKWVDEKGVTHFSSDPPPDGKAQKIEVKPQPRSTGAQPLIPLTPEEARKRALELHEERLAREKRDEDARKNADAAKARCKRAQDTLAMLRSGRRIRSTNERGERVYMEDDARAAETQNAEKAVDAYCR